MQEGGDRGAVVEKVGADVVSDVDQRSLAAVDAHPGAGVDARGGQVFAAAAGEDVDVPPIRRSVALIWFGLPDPQALLGGVLGAEREHRGERLMLAEYSDRAEAEVAGIHHPQRRQVQCAVGFDPFDEHGQFVHVCHDPRRRAGCGSGFRPVAALIHRSVVAGTIRSADIADQVAGIVDPHVVDEGLQFAGTHSAHRVFLAARTVTPQQFLQQAFGGVAVAVRHQVPFRHWQPWRRQVPVRRRPGAVLGRTR